MTAKETKQLIEARKDIQFMQDNFNEFKKTTETNFVEVKEMQQTILDKLEDSDKRFVTRAELKFTQFLLGIVASAVGLFFLLKDHIR
jgi:hypothetical protein